MCISQVSIHIHLSFYPSIYLSTHLLCMYLSIHLSICLSIYLFTHLSLICLGEIQYYEAIGEMESRDPRNSSLKFMYSLPKASSASSSTSASSSSSSSSGICSIAQYEAPVDKSTGTYLCTSLYIINLYSMMLVIMLIR